MISIIYPFTKCSYF